MVPCCQGRHHLTQLYCDRHHLTQLYYGRHHLTQLYCEGHHLIWWCLLCYSHSCKRYLWKILSDVLCQRCFIHPFPHHRTIQELELHQTTADTPTTEVESTRHQRTSWMNAWMAATLVENSSFLVLAKTRIRLQKPVKKRSEGWRLVRKPCAV